MGFASLIKSVFNRSDAAAEETVEQQTEQTGQTEHVQAPAIPMFNRNMPIEVMRDFDTLMFVGRLGKVTTNELTIERVPGEMSLPVNEEGNTVLIRGYDYNVNPIILQAKVHKSSFIEWLLGDCEVNSYENHRKSIRYPLSPPADIYAVEDTALDRPQPCQLINISTGGACIISEFSYTMGQLLRLRVELIKNSGYTSYHCQVVRIVPRKDNLCEYGLLFAQLNKKKTNSLMQDIEDFKKQTEKELQG